MRRSTGPRSRRIGRSHITLLACALLLAASNRPAAVSTGLVISQVYGGGGNSGAPYTHDFVEIFNRSGSPASLAGLSIQYTSATGTGNFGAGAPQSATLPPVNVAPGSYFLVQLAGGAAGAPLPTPDYVDADGPVNMSATAGKVALVTGTATLGCNGGSAACTADQLARIVDLVGFGGANFVEQAAAASPSNATAIVRTAGNTDSDNNAADFVVAAPAPRNGGGTTGPPTLSIDDVSISEGDTTTTLRFTVSLSATATSDVFYSIATEDETASAGLDYQALSLASQVIPAGALTAAHDVTVIGDSVPEATETFAIRLADIGGATPGNVVGRGTITNDDVAFTPIPELQGNGETSPFADADVATAGIVTARKTNGFFLQVPDGEGDGQLETSDAIFVFTSTLPAAAVGDEVRVTGRLVEFSGTGATTVGTLTEITGPSLTVLSSGHALPAPLDLATLLASPASVTSRAAQLERYEGMLVATASMDVVGPSNTFGELFAVISGVPRTFREPGLDVSEPLPAGTPAEAPRFDGNFERLILDSDDLVDAAGVRRPRLDLPAAAAAEPVRVLNVAGPLDYAFDAYRVVLDTSASAAGTRLPVPVPARSANEFTVASLNLENFRDGTANFASRTQKAARIIDEVLRTPDVLGLIEVGNQADLEAVAALVNAATGASYQAYLLDGDGQATGFEQNVGYLVNDARIEVLSTYQLYQGKTFDFAGQTDLLHDRPPFVLEARVRLSGTPFTAVLNHLRSLIDVSSNEFIGGTGLTVGARVREKRRLQAEDLADFVAAHIADNLVVLGDMNAFEFNDGLVDVLGTIAGSPAPAGEVTAPSVDRWTHELVNLATLLPAGERYSYVFEGTAQVLDHVLVNQPMYQRLTRFIYARNNTDFPESFESDFTVTTRLSDHDGAVAYFGTGTDVAVSAAAPASVAAGAQFRLHVTATNGAGTASDVRVDVILPPGLTWQTSTAPAGWNCTTSGETVTCAAAQMASHTSALLDIDAAAACTVPDGSALALPVAITSATPDTNAANDSAVVAVSITNARPVISGASVSRSRLLLPLHQMVPATVRYSAADTCGVVTTSLRVTSDEPVTGPGQGLAGLTSPDWVVVDTHHVQLRAERSLSGNGRVYTVTITAADAAGGQTNRALTVTVAR